MKRFLSLLLLCTMLVSLAACGGQAAETSGPQEDGTEKPISAEGRYVETNITPEGVNDDPDAQRQIEKIWLREDGTLDIIVFQWKLEQDSQYEAGRRWLRSRDQGNSWEEQELPGWEDLSDLYVDGQDNIYGFSMGEDGVLTEFYQLSNGETGQVEVDLGLEGKALLGMGSPRVFQDRYYLMEVYDADDNDILYAINLSDGKVVWKYQAALDGGAPEEGGLYVAGEDGVLDGAGLSGVPVGDSVYVGGSGVHAILDGESGEQTGSFDAQTLQAGLNSIRVNDENTYFYFDDSGNFCRGIFGQAQAETVLEATEYRYGAESSYFYGYDQFAVQADGVIYINVYNDSGEIKLYRFDFDKNATAPAETLTVWSLEENPTIRQAILAFREEHPEIRVDYQVPDLEESGKTLNDVLTSLNTKLLAGEGPDVLILDGIGYAGYAEKGVLADLTELYQENQFVGQTVSSLLDADGSCYVLPARFTAPILFGDGIQTLSTLEELAQAVSGGGTALLESAQTEAEKPYFSMDYESLRDLLWASSAPELIREDGVQAEQLRSWLQALKTISDHFGYFAPNDNDEMGTIVVSASSGSMGYGNQNVLTEEPAIRWAERTAQTGNVQLGAVEELISALTMTEEWEHSTEQFTFDQFPGLAQGVYTPKILMGVSAASEQQEDAKEFVRTALSMEVQRYTYGDGLPVLQEAMDQQLAYFATYASEYGWDIQTLQPFFDSRSVPVITMQEEKQIIDEAAEQYCSGEVSLEDAVAQVQNELALKLAER